MALDEFAHSSPDQLQRGAAEAGREAGMGGATPDTKYGKAEVNYRPAGSSNTRCENCAHFAWSKGSQGKGTCQVVAGVIQPDMVSDRYEPFGGGLQDLITNEPTR
jgi:hypothetical protein